MKGASPVELDYGRNLRADQWARFCGRHTTAEIVEQYARQKLLERTTSTRWPYDPMEQKPLVRSRTGTMEASQGEGNQPDDIILTLFT